MKALKLKSSAQYIVLRARNMHCAAGSYRIPDHILALNPLNWCHMWDYYDMYMHPVSTCA